MLKSYILFFILMILLFSASWAQRYYFDSYGEKAGLEEEVNDLVVDSVGFLWVVTDNGLYRFDGPEFTKMKGGQYSTLSYFSSNGMVAGQKEGLEKIVYNRQDYEFSKLIEFKHSDTSLNPDQWTIGEDGNIWKIRPEGIVKTNGKASTTYEIDNLNGSYTNCQLIQGYDQKLWLTCKSGNVYFFNVNEEAFSKVNRTWNFNEIYAVTPYREHGLLVQSDHGLRLLNINASGQVKDIDSLSHAPDSISTIKVAPNGNIFIGTKHDGLHVGVYENDKYLFNKIFNGNDPHRIEDPPFEFVNAIYIDDSKEIWVAHKKGITLLRERAFTNVSYLLPHNTVTGISQCENGDTYAVIEGSLNKIVDKGNSYHIEVINLDMGLSRPENVTSYGNRLWVTTTDNKIFYIEDGIMSDVLDMSYRGEVIFCIRSDKDGNIWVAQAPYDNPIKGILKISPDLEVTDYNGNYGFKSRMLITKQAPYGTIYCAGIGENNYLYKYNPEDDYFENISAPIQFYYGDNFEVHDMAISKDSVIWLASTAGLLRYENGMIEKIHIQELANNEAVAVGITQDEAIWFFTDRKGVVRYKDCEYVIYNQTVGLPSSFMFYRALYIDKQDKLWLGSRDGVSVSLNSAPSPPRNLQPIFMKLSINDYAITQTESKNSYSIGSTLEASVLSLTYPLEKSEYKYRLLGSQDTSWSAYSFDNDLQFENLSTGEYTLQIKAKQIAGYLESKTLQFSFAIEKVWYATWWGITLYITGGLGVLTAAFFMFYSIKMKRVRIKQMELQRLVKERTSELQNANEQLTRQKAELTSQTKQLNLQSEKLKDHADKLSKKNQELDQFAYIVSHDLKAPLRGITKLTDWIEEDLKDGAMDELKENFALLNDRANRMQNLIDSILNYSRIGKTEAEKNKVNTKDVIDEVLQMVHVPSSFTIDVVGSFPVIYANRTYIEQVFTNLVSNAVKYHDKEDGNITIANDQDENWHIFSVEDDGPGILPEVQEKIFLIFQTLQSKDETESTGVGLTIVKKIIEVQGGKIWVESDGQSGSKFVFTLPK